MASVRYLCEFKGIQYQLIKLISSKYRYRCWSTNAKCTLFLHIVCIFLWKETSHKNIFDLDQSIHIWYLYYLFIFDVCLMCQQCVCVYTSSYGVTLSQHRCSGADTWAGNYHGWLGKTKRNLRNTENILFTPAINTWVWV